MLSSRSTPRRAHVFTGSEKIFVRYAPLSWTARITATTPCWLGGGRTRAGVTPTPGTSRPGRTAPNGPACAANASTAGGSSQAQSR